MNNGDIVTVMTSVGEYIGRLEGFGSNGVTLQDPRLIVRGEDGQIGFGRGVCMSAVENPPKVTFGDTIFTVRTNESFEKAWVEATSGIIV